MRRAFLYFMVLFAIVGCTRPTLSKVQQMVEAQVRLLVDSGLIANKYVVLSELAINDSNHIYRINDSDCPADLEYYNYPSKVIQYKDKYLCFVELDEPQMSADKMIKLTGYSGNLGEESGVGDRWLFAFSKFGEKKTLVNVSNVWGVDILDLTELWPYLSGYVKKYPVQMAVMSHDIELASGCHLIVSADSIKQDLFNYLEHCFNNIHGKMYLKNNTDSTVCLSSDTEMHYAVVNGWDSLYLSLCDTLPIVLKPYERKIIEYKSMPKQAVFLKYITSEKDPWEYLYNLFCHSTYCLMNVNQEDLKTKVMSYDINNYGFKVDFDYHSKVTFRIVNRGMYDKKVGEMQRFRYWRRKWDDMSAADKRRIYDEAQRRFEEYHRKK